MKRAISVIGPGLLVAATGIGAGDLATASFAGSHLGTAVLWAALAGAFLKFVANEGLARWQLATGTTLLEGVVRHFGRLTGWFFLTYLLFWTFFLCLGADERLRCNTACNDTGVRRCPGWQGCVWHCCQSHRGRTGSKGWLCPFQQDHAGLYRFYVRHGHLPTGDTSLPWRCYRWPAFSAVSARFRKSMPWSEPGFSPSWSWHCCC